MRIHEFRDLVDIVEALEVKYGFFKDDATYEAVSTVILHAPPDMGDITLDYIADRVSKMMANKIAYEEIQAIKTRREQKHAATKTLEVADVTSQDKT